MAPAKRPKLDRTAKSRSLNDSLVEKPSDVVKRKVAKRNNSQKLKVEPSSSSSSSLVPKQANDAGKNDVTQKSIDLGMLNKFAIFLRG